MRQVNPSTEARDHSYQSLITLGVVATPVDQTQLRAKILAGDRRSLARAITLTESTRPIDRSAAADLLDSMPPSPSDSISIGISGTPGVGKSTFIEALGRQLIAQGQRLAVLAIDPSSTQGRGAILGDKTRMPTLAKSTNAFVRPSPSGGSLGGLTASTADAKRLLEAGGFNPVFVETVGVGQSEVAVASVCDIFVLLVAPGGGDELQGIKRGVMELADVVVVNKCDGSRDVEGRQTVLEYQSAINMGRRSDRPHRTAVLGCSSFDPASIDAVWAHVQQLHSELHSSGELVKKRSRQRLALLEKRVAMLIGELAHRPHPDRARIERQVLEGSRETASAAYELFSALIESATHGHDSE